MPWEGHFFDKDGTERRETRVNWWSPDPVEWRDVAKSVQSYTPLPSGPLPKCVKGLTYNHEKPIFSAGKDGPMLVYRLEEADGTLRPDRLVVGEVRA